MTATYKQISKGDIEILVGMMKDFYAIDGYPINLAVSAKLFEQFISEEHLGKAWLIYNNNEVAGYVILTFVFNFEYGGKIAFVDELYIKEGLRGKGLGKSAIDFVKSHAADIDLKLLYLEVERHNTKAQELYRDKGFEKHKRDVMFLKLNNK